MSIFYHEASRSFHLQAGETSYVIQIIRDRYLAHRYWGKRIRRFDDSNPIVFQERPLSPQVDPHDRTFSLEMLPQEYPGFGTTDLRHPAFQVRLEDGSTTSELHYVGHRISEGKPALEGLPAVYCEEEGEAETLEVELRDNHNGLKVLLSYTVMDSFGVITRSVSYINESEQELTLLRAASMSLDLEDSHYEMLHLSGGWANERNIVKRPLVQGVQSIESRRGASSPQHNPFVALLRPGVSETNGEVYGFSFVYSGNFLAQVEVDQYDTTRITMGLNPFDFSWVLEPGQSFQTPEVVMVFSDQGLGGMSRSYHKLYRTRLCRGQYRDQVRPVLVNNWEATYFDFTPDKLEELVAKAGSLGIELFVLDDGWFGRRNDDTTSLGDWVVNREKLPGGLEDLAGRVQKHGLQFGIWFEPEMVSVDSDLYREHPDWCIHVKGRHRSTSRSQLILDLSRDEVCRHIVEQLSDILSRVPISYVKWDMNRHMTEVGSPELPPKRQREVPHRYILGLYRMLKELTSTFPHILFESCSSGGGRYDPGMLYYMPQTWTSDNSDAISRLKIQYGTSLVYPVSSMGCHVSDVPNHQVGRITSLQTRANVALSGNFGYELDLTRFTEEENRLVTEQVAFYKEIRELVQFGTFHRLVSPFDGNEAAWMFVDEHQETAMIHYFKILAQPNSGFRTLRLQGLAMEREYKIQGVQGTFYGDELMHNGIRIPPELLIGDFQSKVWLMNQVK